jgi:hypothetical protein
MAVSPIILKLHRDKYLYILKMLNFNLSYDDKFDELFIFDFDIVVTY